MRVWAPKDRVQYGQWALEASINMTEYFEKIFNQNYPISKQGNNYVIDVKSKILCQYFTIILK